jgi:hypothetical protein
MRRIGRFASLSLLLIAACGNNRPPEIQPIGDQVAVVGVELSFEVRASDPDGNSLQFDFDAPGLPDIKTKATLTAFADGVAIFRWTPTAADRNTQPWAFDFRVSDGSATTTETVQIMVSDAAGAAPVFRKPLGTGTTLDLANASCIDIDILVEDLDSTDVDIVEEDPKIAGASLTQTGPFEATWHWCPSTMQKNAQDRFMLTLSATDGSGLATRKNYLIVLRSPPMTGCPGAAPMITHTPPSATSTASTTIPITAMISDDKGIKQVLLYSSDTMPSNPPDLASMAVTTMTRSSGTATSGTYSGSLPSPVAMAAAGTTKTVYYFIVADDDDDANGKCDHSTTAPATGTYSVAVTNPGVEMGAGVCVRCEHDTDCGTADDHCIVIGGGPLAFCSRACGGSFPRCPNGYNCSTNNVTSVDGKSARQCLPTSGSCLPPCTDDNLEQNDTRTTITNTTSASFPTTEQTLLSFCYTPGGAADEDWYAVDAAAGPGAGVYARATFLDDVGFADIDLEVTNSSGSVIDYSYGFDDTEIIALCGVTGKHYLRVFTFDSPPVNENLYDLIFVGKDDPQEPNETYATGFPAGALPGAGKKTFYGNLCPGTQDWWRSALAGNETISVNLLFDPAEGDLDVTLYGDGGTTVVKAGTPLYKSGSTTIVIGEQASYTVPAGQAPLIGVQVKGKTASTTAKYTLEITVN